MNEVQMLVTYNEVTQEEFERFEEIGELVMKEVYADPHEIRECLSFYILKSYLLENKLI